MSDWAEKTARVPLPAVVAPCLWLFVRERLARVESLAVLGLGVVPVAALGSANGGFFPRSWGWAALGLSGLAIGGLLLRRELDVSPRALLFLCVLAGMGLVVAASLSWTRSVGLTILELQRHLVYLAGVGAATLLVRARSARLLVCGVFVGSTAATVWGLVAYLVTRENAPDVFQGSYLHRPMGYANAMAITSVLALLLGLGIAADASSRRARAGAAVALVPLASALALTGSRAGWAALILGAGVAAGLTPDRRRTLAIWRWVIPVPGLAVLVVSSMGATSSRIVGPRADQLGDRLLVLVVVLTVLAVPPALIAARRRERRLEPGPARRVWTVLAILLLATIVFGAARLSGFSGDRPTYWRVAASEFRAKPLLGSGAGTYPQVWLERRSVDTSVRDAHSLVVENLAELGLAGVLAVSLLLGLPLWWAARGRSQPLVPAAAGAFAAYAAHASVDWDWELPAVTLAGLFCAVAIGVLADGERRVGRPGDRSRGVAVGLLGPLVAFAFAGFVGSSALDDAGRSLAAGDAVSARQAARRAERWQPWSAEPLLLQGQAHLALGERDAARVLFARAAARDPNDYRTWLALAAVSGGDAARVAVLRARTLNPRSVRDIPAGTAGSTVDKPRKEAA